jgi:hypothetical protein
VGSGYSHGWQNECHICHWQSMRCPKCHLGDNAAVTCTRHRADGSVRRRHVCLACALRWTTTEEVVLGSLCKAAPPANLVERSRTRR